MKNIDKPLQRLFNEIKKRKTLFLIILILLVLGLFFLSYVKNFLVVILFVVIGALSKIYHKFFKSSLSLDLVLFLTLITLFTYNVLSAFIVAYLGLLGGDYLAGKLRHTSLISLFCLGTIIFIGSLFLGIPIKISLIILLIIYNIISAVIYYFLGSPIQRIITYLLSNFSFNLFLILSLIKLRN